MKIYYLLEKELDALISYFISNIFCEEFYYDELGYRITVF